MAGAQTACVGVGVIKFAQICVGKQMKSIEAEDLRLRELSAWLTSAAVKAAVGDSVADGQLAPASADASFRRYFRITHEGGTVIAMDAPPPQEDCRPFVRIGRMMADGWCGVWLGSYRNADV